MEAVPPAAPRLRMDGCFGKTCAIRGFVFIYKCPLGTPAVCLRAFGPPINRLHSKKDERQVVIQSNCGQGGRFSAGETPAWRMGALS